MSDEPGHKAMLYFLEVLMNSTGPLTISQLAGRFGSSNFTADMRIAAGGNESGLKQFLLKYPSLFTIKGNMVSLCDGKEDDESSTDGKQESCASSRRSLPDVSVEMEAVQFFQGQLAKREERWVPIKSLAGHLSQTTMEIRNIVGPQLDFRKWLLRHMHIFEVQGDLVSLREGLAVIGTPSMNRRITFDIPDDSAAATQNLAAPKTPPMQRKNLNRNGLPLHRSHSFGDRNQMNALSSGNVLVSSNGGVSVKRHESPVTMTANEYKAVMFIKDLLERRGAIELSNLLVVINQSSDGIRGTIGSSVANLESFLNKSSAIFNLTSGLADGQVTVDLVKNAKLSVIITGSRPNPSQEFRPAGIGGSSSALSDGPRGTVHEGKGKIFHVAKLWGIIDLGDHEHVFFDRSIMKQQMDDLQKHFQVGELLSFRATPAHKSSRAKWKASHVWRDGEVSGASETTERASASSTATSATEGSIEDEINEFLPRRLDSSPNLSQSPSVMQTEVHVFGDAQLSGAGVIPIWNFKADEEKNKRASVCVVPESYQMSASVLSDLRFISEFSPSFLYGSKDASSTSAYVTTSEQMTQPGGQLVKPDSKSAAAFPAKKAKEFASIACQTVSTSDIIATQLYQDS